MASASADVALRTCKVGSVLLDRRLAGHHAVVASTQATRPGRTVRRARAAEELADARIRRETPGRRGRRSACCPRARRCKERRRLRRSSCRGSAPARRQRSRRPDQKRTANSPAAPSARRPDRNLGRLYSAHHRPPRRHRSCPRCRSCRRCRSVPPRAARTTRTAGRGVVRGAAAAATERRKEREGRRGALPRCGGAHGWPEYRTRRAGLPV